jgi:hypothetical protein
VLQERFKEKMLLESRGWIIRGSLKRHWSLGLRLEQKLGLGEGGASYEREAANVLAVYS